MEPQSTINPSAADLPRLPDDAGQGQYLYVDPVPQASQPAIANTPLQVVSAVHVPGEDMVAVNLNLPSMADDSDLIEKEWVNKVKEIIRAYKDDPYQQSRLLSLAKADYMQKRYNKMIKPAS